MGPSFLVAVFVVDLLQESESENRERGAYDNASGISISISTEERVARLSVCLRGFGPEGVCQSRTRTPTRLSFCPVGVCVSFLLFRPPLPFPALLCPSLPSAASVLSLSFSPLHKLSAHPSSMSALLARGGAGPRTSLTSHAGSYEPYSYSGGLRVLEPCSRALTLVSRRR